MTEIDTSSYPKPQAPVNPLDVAGKLGTLQMIPGQLQQQQQQIQQSAIGIDQAKLKLYNDHFQIMQNELSTLANDPKTTKEEVLARMHRIGDGFNMPDGVRKQMEAEFANAPSGIPIGKDGSTNPILSRTLDLIMKRGMDMSQRINSQYGAPGAISDGQNVTPSRTFLRGGPVPSGAPIAQQVPPTTPSIDSAGKPALLGSQPIQTPPDTSPVPGGFPGQYTNRLGATPPLPIGPMSTDNLPTNPLMRKDEKVTSAEVMPPTIAPRGAPTGTSPDYEPGLKQFSQDQELATQKLTAIKPAIQALPLLKDLTTGIGTETYNKALAGLHNLGWLPQDMTDKVEAYQIANKKLADYLRTSPLGQRSDAAQALSQSASPDPKGQINQALVKLTKDAIALDRAQAIRAVSFTDNNGNFRRDYHNYGNHRSTLPAKIDEKALTIDMLPDEERNKLLDEMKKKQNTFQGKKFKYTLELAEKAGLFDTSQ